MEKLFESNYQSLKRNASTPLFSDVSKKAKVSFNSYNEKDIFIEENRNNSDESEWNKIISKNSSNYENLPNRIFQSMPKFEESLFIPVNTQSETSNSKLDPSFFEENLTKDDVLNLNPSRLNVTHLINDMSFNTLPIDLHKSSLLPNLDPTRNKNQQNFDTNNNIIINDNSSEHTKNKNNENSEKIKASPGLHNFNKTKPKVNHVDINKSGILNNTMKMILDSSIFNSSLLNASLFNNIESTEFSNQTLHDTFSPLNDNHKKLQQLQVDIKNLQHNTSNNTLNDTQAIMNIIESLNSTLSSNSSKPLDVLKKPKDKIDNIRDTNSERQNIPSFYDNHNVKNSIRNQQNLSDKNHSQKDRKLNDNAQNMDGMLHASYMLKNNQKPLSIHTNTVQQSNLLSESLQVQPFPNYTTLPSQNQPTLLNINAQPSLLNVNTQSPSLNLTTEPPSLPFNITPTQPLLTSEQYQQMLLMQQQLQNAYLQLCHQPQYPPTNDIQGNASHPLVPFIDPYTLSLFNQINNSLNFETNSNTDGACGNFENIDSKTVTTYRNRIDDINKNNSAEKLNKEENLQKVETNLSYFTVKNNTVVVDKSEVTSYIDSNIEDTCDNLNKNINEDSNTSGLSDQNFSPGKNNSHNVDVFNDKTADIDTTNTKAMDSGFVPSEVSREIPSNKPASLITRIPLVPLMSAIKKENFSISREIDGGNIKSEKSYPSLLDSYDGVKASFENVGTMKIETDDRQMLHADGGGMKDADDEAVKVDFNNNIIQNSTSSSEKDVSIEKSSILNVNDTNVSNIVDNSVSHNNKKRIPAGKLTLKVSLPISLLASKHKNKSVEKNEKQNDKEVRNNIIKEEFHDTNSVSNCTKKTDHLISFGSAPKVKEELDIKNTIKLEKETNDKIVIKQENINSHSYPENQVDVSSVHENVKIEIKIEKLQAEEKALCNMVLNKKKDEKVDTTVENCMDEEFVNEQQTHQNLQQISGYDATQVDHKSHCSLNHPPSIPSNQYPEHYKICYQCGLALEPSILAFCSSQHSCCSTCLFRQVKTWLTTDTKEAFACQQDSCSSFYDLSKLSNILPKLIVESMEEKLEFEYNRRTSLFLKKVNNNLLPVTSIKLDRDDYWPHLNQWNLIDEFEEFKLIEVPVNSKDYSRVSKLFHKTMKKPRASLVSVRKLLNPLLWKYYQMTKDMKEKTNKKQQENSGYEQIFNNNAEKMLFHGIKRKMLDVVCKENIDWRKLGVSHGVIFGQGTYFAKDASYAHKFTDKPKRRLDTQKNLSHFDELEMSFMDSLSNEKENIKETDSKENHLKDGLSGEQKFKNVVQNESLKIETSTENNTCDKPSEATKHLHSMLLTRVYVGRYTQGKRSHRKPPPIDPSNPYSICYDSCVNYPKNPTLFVVSDVHQYYPEYVIEYTNEKVEKSETKRRPLDDLIW